MAEPHWIQVNYKLTIEKAEENRGDEPRLQFVFITERNGRATVELVESGRLANNAKNRREIVGAVSCQSVPDRGNPFFAMIVRALEDDNSRASDRRRDRANLEASIVSKAQALLDAGNLNSDELWVSANNAPLVDRAFRDDDDRIGVILRRFPDFGVDLANANDNTFHTPYSTSFLENDAVYKLVGDISEGYLI